jgi:lipid A 3-O-deacylase
MKKAFLSVLCALAAATPAQAGELFGGLYVHDVDTPLTKSGIEGGMDVQLGYRWDRIGRTPLQPYAFAAANTAGETHYAALGLSAKFGDRVFVRPGLGIAVHTGSDDKFNRTDKIAFGSRVLFEPELGVGMRLSDRATLEASWVHMSHAQLFGRQNPGIDNIGARLSWKL